jgi:hypothetical protein
VGMPELLNNMRVSARSAQSHARSVRAESV